MGVGAVAASSRLILAEGLSVSPGADGLLPRTRSASELLSAPRLRTST